MGLQVIVHTGLTDEQTARGLNDSGIDQALFDVIGDRGDDPAGVRPALYAG